MLYLPDPAAPTPAAFAPYDVVTAPAVADRPDDVVVIPEVFVGEVDRLPAASKVVWWLSVDNFLAEDIAFDFAARPRVRHLVGSAYARDFLGKRGLPAQLLSGYVHPSFGAGPGPAREDLVLYNPKKGLATIEALRDAAPDLAWTAIADLTRAEVAALLRRGKVYVDFGHHPGRERLPREAALAGCCVITGTRGSAGFDEDVPIPPAYKLDEAHLPEIALVLRACVREWDTRRKHFAAYADRVRAEPHRFAEGVRAIFGSP